MKENAYRQDLCVCVCQSASTENGVNTVCVNNNHAKYFPQTLRPIVYALQNFDRNFANLVAPPTDISPKCVECYKAHLVP